MAYLSTASASSDMSDWTLLDATWGDDPDDMQVARCQVTFSNDAATATVGLALVDQSGTVYAYYEGYAAALARRSAAANGSGNYIGAITFTSSTPPSSYAHDGSDKVDLMHGVTDDYSAGSGGPLVWKFGVPTLSGGTVNVTFCTSKVV